MGFCKVKGLLVLLCAFPIMGLLTECRAENPTVIQGKNEPTNEKLELEKKKYGGRLLERTRYDDEFDQVKVERINAVGRKTIVTYLIKTFDNLPVWPGEEYPFEFDIKKDYESIEGLIIDEKGIRKKSGVEKGVYYSKPLKVQVRIDDKLIEIPQLYEYIFVKYDLIGSRTVKIYYKESDDGINWIGLGEGNDWLRLYQDYLPIDSPHYYPERGTLSRKFIKYKVIFDDDSTLNDFKHTFVIPNTFNIGFGGQKVLFDFTKQTDYETLEGAVATPKGLIKNEKINEGIVISKPIKIEIRDRFNTLVEKPMPCIMINLAWIGSRNASLYIRISEDGEKWSEWIHNKQTTEVESDIPLTGLDPIPRTTKYIQCKMILRDTEPMKLMEIILRAYGQGIVIERK